MKSYDDELDLLCNSILIEEPERLDGSSHFGMSRDNTSMMKLQGQAHQWNLDNPVVDSMVEGQDVLQPITTPFERITNLQLVHSDPWDPLTIDATLCFPFDTLSRIELLGINAKPTYIKAQYPRGHQRLEIFRQNAHQIHTNDIIPISAITATSTTLGFPLQISGTTPADLTLFSAYDLMKQSLSQNDPLEVRVAISQQECNAPSMPQVSEAGGFLDDTRADFQFDSSSRRMSLANSVADSGYDSNRRSDTPKRKLTDGSSDLGDEITATSQYVRDSTNLEYQSKKAKIGPSEVPFRGGDPAAIGSHVDDTRDYSCPTIDRARNAREGKKTTFVTKKDKRDEHFIYVHDSGVARSSPTKTLNRHNTDQACQFTMGLLHQETKNPGEHIAEATSDTEEDLEMDDKDEEEDEADELERYYNTLQSHGLLENGDSPSTSGSGSTNTSSSVAATPLSIRTSTLSSNNSTVNGGSSKDTGSRKDSQVGIQRQCKGDQLATAGLLVCWFAANGIGCPGKCYYSGQTRRLLRYVTSLN